MGRTALTWNGDELVSEIENISKEKLARICQAVIERYRQLLGVQGTKDSPSNPGQPPKRQSGDLESGFSYSVESFGTLENKATIYLEDDLDYGVMLDQGTSRIEPRPWVMRGLNESIGEAMRILEE